MGEKSKRRRRDYDTGAGGGVGSVLSVFFTQPGGTARTTLVSGLMWVFHITLHAESGESFLAGHTACSRCYPPKAASPFWWNRDSTDFGVHGRKACGFQYNMGQHDGDASALHTVQTRHSCATLTGCVSDDDGVPSGQKTRRSHVTVFTFVCDAPSKLFLKTRASKIWT